MITLREASKSNWSVRGDLATEGEIKVGALQRIADATEAMARRHRELMDDCARWENRARSAETRLDTATRRINALRGVITKMKKAKDSQ